MPTGYNLKRLITTAMLREAVTVYHGFILDLCASYLVPLVPICGLYGRVKLEKRSSKRRVLRCVQPYNTQAYEALEFGLVSLGLHYFLRFSSAALIVVFIPKCCWVYSAFSV